MQPVFVNLLKKWFFKYEKNMDAFRLIFNNIGSGLGGA